jgi:hypothetical protein
MAKATAVLDHSGLRVRLRGEANALSGCIVEGNGTEHRYTLIPNKWCKVDEIVFDFLKKKFESIPEVEVPDFDVDTYQRTPRMESTRPGYIMEFDSKEKS